MLGQQDLNSSLARQLDETRRQDEEDAELSGRLHDAEGLLNKFKEELHAKEAKARVSFYLNKMFFFFFPGRQVPIFSYFFLFF